MLDLVFDTHLLSHLLDRAIPGEYVNSHKQNIWVTDVLTKKKQISNNYA